MNKVQLMLKRAGRLWVGVVLFSSPAFAQDIPQLTDPEIAAVAVTANQIDVNYGNIAIKHGHDPRIIKFAKNMVQDHSAVIKQAVALANKLGVTPKENTVTQSLLDGEKKTAKALRSKKGKAFDKAYIDNEVAYHEAVINAVKNVLIPQTKNPQLKDLLIKVSPILVQHLEHARMVQANFK